MFRIHYICQICYIYFFKGQKIKRRLKSSREELLTKKRMDSKAKLAKLKLDSESYEIYKEKERQRYYKRIESKKLLRIKYMTPKQQRAQRRRWKQNQRVFRQRKEFSTEFEHILVNSTFSEE